MANPGFNFPARVTAATVTVELPVSHPIYGLCVTRTSSEWALFFEKYADSKENFSLDLECKRCCDMINWAIEAGGWVYAVNNTYGPSGISVAFVFSFGSFDHLTNFVRNLNSKVF